MNPVREIEICGKPRKALFSVFLWRVLENEGVKVELSTDAEGVGLQSQMSALCEFVKIIYGALKNAIDCGLEQDYSPTLLDVDLWATENRKEFYLLIPYIVQTLTDGNHKGDHEPSEVEKVKKKSLLSRMFGK